jgi:hypothetical protein
MRALGFIHRLLLIAGLLLNGVVPASAFEMPTAGAKVVEQKVSTVQQLPCPKHSKSARAAVQGKQMLVDDTVSANEERPRPPSSSAPNPRPDNNPSKPSRHPCCLSGACAHTCFTTVGLIPASPTFGALRVPTEVARSMQAHVRSVAVPPLTRPPII